MIAGTIIKPLTLKSSKAVRKPSSASHVPTAQPLVRVQPSTSAEAVAELELLKNVLNEQLAEVEAKISNVAADDKVSVLAKQITNLEFEIADYKHKANEELLAKKKNINNTPTDSIKKTIFELVTKVLQPIRDAWGQPIVVTCGYRCKALNTAVGGASNSDHLFGAAADIRTKSDTPQDNKKLFDLIVKMANEGKIKCRQIIDEYNYNWVHVSINHKSNSQKNNQIVHVK